MQIKLQNPAKALSLCFVNYSHQSIRQQYYTVVLKYTYTELQDHAQRKRTRTASSVSFCVLACRDSQEALSLASAYSNAMVCECFILLDAFVFHTTLGSPIHPFHQFPFCHWFTIFLFVFLFLKQHSQTTELH